MVNTISVVMFFLFILFEDKSVDISFVSFICLYSVSPFYLPNPSRFLVRKVDLARETLPDIMLSQSRPSSALPSISRLSFGFGSMLIASATGGTQARTGVEPMVKIPVIFRYQGRAGGRMLGK